VLQTLVDYAGLLVLQIDLKGRVVWFNGAFERLSGCPLESTAGRDWVDVFIPAAEQPLARQLCKGMVGKARGDAHTKSFRSRDGSIRHIEWFHRDILDSAGRASGILCIGRDVTEIHSARLALAEAEQRNRAVLETAVNAIITINDCLLIETVNSSTERMFGYGRDEMIGQNVAMLMPEPYASQHDDYVENYKRTGQKKIIGIGREAVARRKDGTVFPIDLSVGEVRLENGRRFFTGIIRDLSSRRELEEKILRISEEERQRIGRDIHDDLCQQLAAIGCLARVTRQRLGRELREEKLAGLDEIVTLLTEANQNARSMARGLMPVALDTAGLPAALEELAGATSRIYRLECRVEICPDVPALEQSASVQFYRIAQEALGNAAKHSGATQVEIILEESDGWLTLAVRDDGRGIPDHSPVTGTGMGLLTMDRRARMIGGDLRVESAPGAGTVVTCRLPLISQAGAAGQRSAAEVTAA
jgi:two-component system sensor kinase FixL